MATLMLQGLAKRFGPAFAVDHIDLTIRAGELVTLLGPSGCGKTTTLRLIAGFLTPDAGEIRVGERVVSAPGQTLPPEQRGMSMIFQSYAVWPHMTVFDNVAFGLSLRKLPRDEIARRTHEALDLVRLRHLAERYPSQLSGGQQQRVALARALVVEPEILLLDEPLSNLDAQLRAEMRFEIRQLHQRLGFTTVYVTHDQSEAMVTADRVVIMNLGRIEQVGAPREVYLHPASRFVANFIGQSNCLRGTLTAPDALDLGGMVVRVVPQAGFGPGRAAELVVRPHSLRLAPADTPAPVGCNAFSGRVLDAVFLGDRVEYRVQMDGTGAQLTAEADPYTGFSPGERVALHVDPARCCLVPAE